MKKFYQAVFVSFPEKLLIALVTVMTFSAFLQVLTRYVLKAPLPWTEELARYMFIWNTCIGAGVGYRYGKHVILDLLINYLVRGAAEFYHKLVVHLFVGVTGAFMLIEGFNLALLAQTTESPALPISMMYVYLAVPVGGFLITVYALEALIMLFKTKFSAKQEDRQKLKLDG